MRHALDHESVPRGEDFVVEMRAKKPIVIIDAYYDGEGQALCPAATGISHHINPWGDIEPCPIIQFTRESIHATAEDPRSLRDKFIHSAYLREFRELAAATTRGCIVLERPELLASGWSFLALRGDVVAAVGGWSLEDPGSGVAEAGRWRRAARRPSSAAGSAI